MACKIGVICQSTRTERRNMPKHNFDALDRKILAALQRDARLTNVELAEEVGLSPSPCLRRVRMLEEAGVISAYRALLDRKAVGLDMTVFVGIQVSQHDEVNNAAFQAAVRAIPQVVTCHLVAGESDFLLQVVVPDLASYERV